MNDVEIIDELRTCLRSAMDDRDAAQAAANRKAAEIARLTAEVAAAREDVERLEREAFHGTRESNEVLHLSNSLGHAERILADTSKRAERAEAEVARLREGNETTIRLLNDAITVTKRMTSGNVGHLRGALVGQLQNTRDILREKGGE